MANAFLHDPALERPTRSAEAPAIRKPAGPDARRHSWRDWLQLIKQALAAWVADYAPSMGAALSYYSLFSMAPLLLVVISVAGLVFGEEAVRGEVFGQLQGLLGSEASRAIESVLASVSSKPMHGIASTVIGLAVMLVGATTVFGELQDALDRIWRVPPRDRSGGLWKLLRARVLSFGVILGMAFLLIVSLVIGAAVAAFGKWWSGAFGGWELLVQAANFVIGFVLTVGIFAMIYKLMPRARVQWHDVWLGAAVTALLFTIGRYLIGLYIGKSGVASAFGAAGSLIVVLVWVYYSAQIFLVGAEFTWAYARTFGSMRQQAQGEATKIARIPNADSETGTLTLHDGDQARRMPAGRLVPAPARPAKKRSKGFGAGVATGFVAGLLLIRWTRKSPSGEASHSILWGSLLKVATAAREDAARRQR